MKKLVYVLFGLCFQFVFGQNTDPLFLFVNPADSLNEEQQSRLEHFSSLDYVDSVKIITVSSLASVQNNGKIAVNIPNHPCGLVYYMPKYVNYVQEGEYKWSGALFYGDESCECNGGELIIVSNDSHKYGAFSIGDYSYEYWDLTGGKQALLYLKSETEITGECLQTGTTGAISIEPTAKTSSCVVKTLVLYNDYAENTWIDIEDKANLAVTQCNSAYRNSDVSDCDLEMVLVGVEHIDFDQTNVPLQDVKDLCGNLTAQNLRAQYNADMVVLLGSKYPSAYGIAASLNVVPDSAYAIVSIHTATRSGRWTFVHETGHLFGSYHDLTTDTISARGHRFIDKDFCQKITIMAVLQTLVDTRVLHYSNPDVKWHEVETGTPTNNVAEQLRNAACVVGNFMEDSPSLDVLLTGDSKVCPCKQAYFSAQISGGSQPYSGYWQYSTDGINWFPSNPTPVACGVNLNYATQLGCNHLDYKFVRLTVFSANGLSTSRTRYVEVDENMNCPLRISRVVDSYKIYPNPATEEVILEIIAEESSESEYEIYEIGGSVMVKGRCFLQKGRNEIPLTTSSLSKKGNFILHIRIGEKAYSQPFILN